MKANFDRAFKYTVGHEGGYGNDRRDRGNWSTGVIGQGKLLGTKYGISGMSYPHLDIKNLTLEQAKEIYRKDFWRPTKCDDLPSGLDLVVWDAAVNSGGGRSVRWLQTAAGGIQVDGLIGPGTLEKVADRWEEDWEDLLEDTINLRWMYMQTLGTFPIYKNGWRTRILGIGAEARKWARETVPATPAIPVASDPTNLPQPSVDVPSSRIPDEVALPELGPKDYDRIVDLLKALAYRLGFSVEKKET